VTNVNKKVTDIFSGDYLPQSRSRAHQMPMGSVQRFQFSPFHCVTEIDPGFLH
jgi:hypothetical protein